VASDERDDLDRPVTSGTENEAELLNDRRRPGRIDEINPSLVGLFRGTPIIDPDGALHQPRATEAGEKLSQMSQDDLKPSRGIMNAILISSGLWLVICAVGWLVYRVS
jgi:hypothetical protein